MLNMNFGIMITFGATHFSGSANANFSPFGQDGAVTSDLGLVLLHKIASR